MNVRAGARFLCLALFLAGVAPASAQTTAPYEIDVLVSLAGPASFLGRSIQFALQAEERVINAGGGVAGRPVRIVILDDRSDAATAVQLTNQLIAKGTPAIVGPAFAQNCAATRPLVMKNGPVLYCLSNAPDPEPRGYSFNALLGNDTYIMTGMRYLYARGVRKLALLDSTDFTGHLGEEGALAALKSPELAGMQVVANEHFALGDVTVAAQIAKIKASGAQAVWTWTFGTGLGTVLHGVADAGLDLPILTLGGNINDVQMEQYAAFLPKDLLFAGPSYFSRGERDPRVTQARDTFTAALRSAGVFVPDQAYMLAWDPMLIVVEALRHAGPNPTAQQVHDYIEALHGFPGINGVYDFRDGNNRGLPSNAGVIVKYEPRSKQWYGVSKVGGLPL